MKQHTFFDSNGAHIEWTLDGVTAGQLDWFWNNMDKCDYLWHPDQHNGFSWFISPQQQKA